MRGIAVLASACIFLSGCLPAARRAERARERIAPGMTSEEVRDQVGDPVEITRGEPGQPEVWLYQYLSGAGTVATILIVVLVIGLVILIVAAGGGGAFFGGLQGDDNVAEFRVTLDGAGKVVDISPIVVFPKQ